MYTAPSYDCDLCLRLRGFILENRKKFPDKFNGPVPSFGDLSAQILIVGLGPGLRGANFTGRPFTADYAGDLLYPTLIKFGLAKGVYGAHKDDGLELVNTRITNAVRCVPPQNKPETDEIKTCNNFLAQEIAAMPDLKVILSLGLVSHNAVLRAQDKKLSAFKFGHGQSFDLGQGVTLVDSYHCSRYNTNTGRLTTEMFENVVGQVKGAL